MKSFFCSNIFTFIFYYSVGDLLIFLVAESFPLVISAFSCLALFARCGFCRNPSQFADSPMISNTDMSRFTRVSAAHARETDVNTTTNEFHDSWFNDHFVNTNSFNFSQVDLKRELSETVEANISTDNPLSNITSNDL